MTNRKTSGFTLLELIVVISIIAVFAATGVTSFSALNRNSRDSRRQVDLEQIRAALELFKSNSAINSYPSSTNALVPEFLSTVPSDPIPARGQYIFTRCPAACNGTTTACTTYILSTTLENGTAYRLNPYGVTTTATCP